MQISTISLISRVFYTIQRSTARALGCINSWNKGNQGFLLDLRERSSA